MELKVIQAPRLEIALVPVGDGLYDSYMLLHVPDGKQLPTPIQLDGGPFDKVSAIDFILEVYTAIGKKYAVPVAKFGMAPPKSPFPEH